MVFELYDKNGVYVGEKVLLNHLNDYVGILTGKIYSRIDYAPKPLKTARVVNILPDEVVNIYKQFNRCNLLKGQSTKRKFLNCIIEVAYSYDTQDGHKVYKCEDIGEYFYDTELSFFN